MTYKVPFVNYPEQFHKQEKETMSTVNNIFANGDYILRSQVDLFERNIASLVGVKHAIGLNSGTDGMWLPLIAAEIKPGDEIITVAHTFVATVAVIVHCGAIPVLIDIGEDYNMNVDLIEKEITPKTKVIMPVHLNGRLCNMDKLMKIAFKYNLIVIEDAAQSLGASFNGKKAGSFGLASSFSFYPAKILGGPGDGGIAVTNNDKIAETIRLLRDHGQDRATGDILYYGYNSRLDNLQAAILNVRLKLLPQWIERRREIANFYHIGLSDITSLKLPPKPDLDSCYFDVFTNFVIRTPLRDKLVAYLRESGIEILISWPKPMHHHKALKLDHFNLPVTEIISREVLSLPLNTEITNDQVEYVIASIHKFFRSKI